MGAVIFNLTLYLGGAFCKGGDAFCPARGVRFVGPQSISHALSNGSGKQRGSVKVSAVAVRPMFLGIMKACYLCFIFGLLTSSYGVRAY